MPPYKPSGNYPVTNTATSGNKGHLAHGRGSRRAKKSLVHDVVWDPNHRVVEGSCANERILMEGKKKGFKVVALRKFQKVIIVIFPDRNAGRVSPNDGPHETHLILGAPKNRAKKS